MKHTLLLLLCLVFALPVQAQEVPRSRAEIALSFAPIVKKVAPAVVNIYTRTLVRAANSPFLNDPLFRQFFGNRLPGGLTRERIQNSLGSGVIVAPEGLVVTNNHVIEDAQQVRVALSDRREYEADVVSTDPSTDLAILRLRTKGETFPTLPLMDSDEAQVGDLVLAIGDPFAVGQTVTMGIVSAVARSAAVHSGDVNYFIQTDASINPGNSGGALVSADGRLIGIPSAIYSRDGGSVGIGFAIPSNLVRAVLASVGKEGKIVRGWTGIYGQTLTADLAGSVGIDRPGGVIVKNLHPASPAKEAGVRVGDVIRAVNGREIEDADAFSFRLATTSIGSKLDLQVYRKGQVLNVPLTLAAPPENPPRRERLLQGRQPLAGVHVANLSPALAQELGIEDTAEGVIVLKVDQPSNAAMLGVTRGDKILGVNGREIHNVEQLEGALAPSDKGWRITLSRGGTVLTLMVSP
ncbi:MAG: Do family serine endopeptidase [Proteobacteria bacterium]|nr:Do family serine endopeptidase [Pseudomonadota bacterium]